VTLSIGSKTKATDIESMIAETYSIVGRKWLNATPGTDPKLELNVIIPPDSKPVEWSSLQTPKSTFELTIEATLTNEQEMLPKILPLRKSCALVMKGGGIKGLAYVGALGILSDHYNFDHFVGTSAGAITAVLLAADFSSKELSEILEKQDFHSFFDSPWYLQPINLAFYRGLHHAHTLTDWIDTLLAKKLDSATRVKLSDLPNRATVFASRRDRDALIFDPIKNDVEAGHGVRCSMSIPFVFVPQSDQGFKTYDGGMRHNFPIEKLREINPECDFLCLFLGSEHYKPTRNRFEIAEWISIWTEGADAEALRNYSTKTVVIDPSPIGTLDFDLTVDEKKYLLICGKVGALAYLEKGSEAHRNAIADKEQLVESVYKSCSARNRKRKCWRTIAIIGIVVLLLLMSYLAWSLLSAFTGYLWSLLRERQRGHRMF